jgi:hypothetical protein
MIPGSNGCKLAGTALVCFSILVYEILSARLLSVVLEPHLIIFSIALAMLGMGAATSMMSLTTWPAVNSEKDRSLSWAATALGISYLLSLIILVLISNHVNFAIKAAIDGGGLTALVETIRSLMLKKMVWVGSVIFIPYFIFGIFIAILFKSSPGPQYHKLYAADLIGAAAGCILAIVSLEYFGYVGCLTLILVSTFLAAVAFSLVRSKRGAILNSGLAILVVFALLGSNFISYLEPTPEIRKLARNYQNTYDEVNEEWHAWNALSRVALLSLTRRQTGERKWLYAHESGNGWARLPREELSSPKPLQHQDQASQPPSNLATMFEPRRVLVLFAGVGGDMVDIDRLCGGKCDITGVEINRQMVTHALTEGDPRLREFLSRPGIELHVAEAREYLERDTSRYDAILLSWWGAGASHYVGTSGMLAQYLYTKEAFETLLDHLTADGTLIIYNGSKARALTIFRQIFDERNLGNLADRAVVLRVKHLDEASSERGFYDLLEQMRLVVKPSGFAEGELTTVRRAAESIGYNVILSPEGVDPTYGLYWEIANGADMDAINRNLIATENIELSVPTDDRPFFNDLIPQSYYLDPGMLFSSNGNSVPWKIKKTFLYFIIFLSFVALCLIMGPLLLKAGPDLSVGNIVKLLYFLSLGAGFILIEVGLVRKLGLILGHPSYSISIVLAALIFSTGIGSLSSDRLFGTKILTVRRTAMMIVLCTVASAVLYGYFAKDIIVLPLVAKAAIVIVSLFPLGFLMGQLFPQGLVAAGGVDSRLVPWAWAINGTASTIFVGVGYFLSFPLGFNMLLYIGAAIYAGIIFLPLEQSGRRPVVGAVKAPA